MTETMTASADVAAEASSSSMPSQPGPSTTHIEQLVLDAGPLLAQLPLNGVAKQYYVPPQVMAELRDKRAREHLEFLKISGMDLQVREAGPEAFAKGEDWWR